jgi:hypothetical protein
VKEFEQSEYLEKAQQRIAEIKATQAGTAKTGAPGAPKAGS